MPFRNNLFASSALAFIYLGGASTPVSAADTKPIVRETCAQTTLVNFRPAGHPGKSILPSKRVVREVVQCAAAEGNPLILASYTDARGGRALVRGRTERALEQIYAKKFGSISAYEQTNLCAAYTVLRQWSQAGDACDTAVSAALNERVKTRKQVGGSRLQADKDVAAAYSNRAVMHWLSRNEVAAHNDLAKARNFAPNEPYVMRNLLVTELRPSLARAQENLARGS